MKILMISGDSAIMDTQSEVHRRMRWYASMCDELHIIALCHDTNGVAHHGNLFLYPANGNVVARRIRAYRIGRAIAKQIPTVIVTAQAPDEIGLIAYMIAKSRKRNMRLQLQVHTDIMSPWYRRMGIVQRIKYILARFLLPRANCVRAVSKRIATSLVNELKIDSSLISVLPIFTDVRQFVTGKSSEAKQIHAGKNGACQMIAVGRFADKEKNFHMLIFAMREALNTGADAMLTLIGDGPDKVYYESLIKTLNLGAHVFVESWQDDMSHIYHSFDVCVIPSYIEGWGRVAVEAIASGLPVIMTDVGLAGDLVQDGVNGRVVPVNDRSALAHAIINFCAFPEQQIILTRGAQQTANHLASLTPEDYLVQWKKSFERCISPNSVPPLE